MRSSARRAPPASKMRSVALMISGPIPSPYATVTGTFFAVAGVVDNSFSLKPFVVTRRGGRLFVRRLPPPLLGVPSLAYAVWREIPQVARMGVTQRLIVDECRRRVAQ